MSAYRKSFCNNVLDPGHWLSPAQNLDTMRTDICEDLAHLAHDITMAILSTSEKGVTFTVIYLMDFPEVGE